MRVKVNDGKTKDVAITDVTPENYIVPSNEQHLYHCIIEVRKFDSETGKRLSVPRIQKFGKKSFENGIAEHLKKQGYTITVLHDPNEYVKAQAEEKENLSDDSGADASQSDAKSETDSKESDKVKQKRKKKQKNDKDV